MFTNRLTRLLLVLPVVCPCAARATWSICIADSHTNEIAIGTVTCVENIDLLAFLPVVVVGKGVGASQAVVDSNGARRQIIFNGLMAGMDPAGILTLLSAQPSHQSRQYGVADTQGRTMTFTGTSTSQWAGGVTGSIGSLVYAIQGNILSGGCVVPAIEQAVQNTVGDIPEKLMAGMEAARDQGGDGRCSCPGGTAPCVPCPPTSFTKPGHIGGVIVARIGDTDDALCNAGGCADGNYFLRLNVANQTAAGPEPVARLRSLFTAWRNALNGRPDAVRSAAQVTPDTIMPFGGRSTAVLDFTLLDWSGQPITASIQSVTVVHGPDSAGVSIIGAVVDHGGGSYSVPMDKGSGFGVDRFRITVDDGTRPVTLMPDPTLAYLPNPVPAVSQTGLVLGGILLLTASGWVFTRLRRTST